MSGWFQEEKTSAMVLEKQLSLLIHQGEDYETISKQLKVNVL